MEHSISTSSVLLSDIIPSGNHLPHQKKGSKNSIPFSIKSTFSGGINRIYDEIPHAWDEIRLDGGWVDLLFSEAKHRRFHPCSLGFHPAKQDFIKFVWLVRIIFVLASLFVFSRKI